MRRAAGRLLLAVSLDQLCGDSKVGQLGIAVPVEQNVARLDVAVNLACIVQVLEALQRRVADCGNLELRKLLLRDLDDVLDAPCIAVL